ncbi:MAG: Fic family protein [Patescibacteria group bacterium]|nr:Fic family protein [Patescibacteria group bacterium]
MIAKKQGETSYKQTAFGVIPRSKLIPLEIEGIKRAWDFVLQKHSKGVILITPTFIQKIHAIGFKWIFPKIGGRFRVIDVTVSDYAPPKFYLVPSLMADFCQDIKVRLVYLPNIDNSEFLNKIIEFLAWMHHKFLWIHPFQDYNGRIGRLLINIILLNLNLPPIELKVETKESRKKYVKALQEADKNNFKSLEKIIKLAIKETAKELLEENKK